VTLENRTYELPSATGLLTPSSIIIVVAAIIGTLPALLPWPRSMWDTYRTPAITFLPCHCALAGAYAPFLWLCGDGPWWSMALMVIMVPGMMQLAGLLFDGFASVGMVLGTVIYCVAMKFSKARRAHWLSVMMCWICGCNAGTYILLRVISRLHPGIGKTIALFGLSFCYYNVGFALLIWVICYVPVGLPTVVVGSLMYLLCGTREMLNLMGFMQVAFVKDTPVSSSYWLGGCVVWYVVGSQVNRTMVISRIFFKLLSSTKLASRIGHRTVYPEEDLFLRSSFIFGIYIVQASMVCGVCLLCKAGDLEWAHEVLLWWSFLAYIFATLTSDCIVVVLHRVLHAGPAEGEWFLRTWMRLREPRQQWPHLQINCESAEINSSPGVVSATLDAVGARWSNHRVFTDHALSYVTVVTTILVTIPEALATILVDGPCGIQVPKGLHDCVT